MIRILIDTCVYSQAMRGDPAKATLLRRCEEILFSPIVLGELLAGFRRGRHEAENRLTLEAFLSSSRVRLVAVTQETAAIYADLLTRLHKAGSPVPTNDLWIASSALQHHAVMATTDGHFRKIPGVNLAKIS